jgi:hypothetical protein
VGVGVGACDPGTTLRLKAADAVARLESVTVM